MPSAAPLIITLDGPAGVGKSSIASRLAGQLGIAFLDTGAMFRAAAYTLGEGAWDWTQGLLQQKLGDFEFTLRGSGRDTELLLNGQPLPPAIRSEEAGRWASQLAVVPSVRAHMKMAQIFLGQTTSLVAEGRDMGTVVFPARPTSSSWTPTRTSGRAGAAASWKARARRRTSRPSRRASASATTRTEIAASRRSSPPRAPWWWIPRTSPRTRCWPVCSARCGAGPGSPRRRHFPLRRSVPVPPGLALAARLPAGADLRLNTLGLRLVRLP
jgi:cytidylate kinase